MRSTNPEENSESSGMRILIITWGVWEGVAAKRVKGEGGEPAVSIA